MLLILLGLLGTLAYISNSSILPEKFKGEQNKIIRPQTQKKQLSEEERILDCAKKIALNDDLLKGEVKELDDNCLFMGCGDFFR